ncbi:hypothetical protein NECAME_05348 [Necator americanus]|uniref:Uncharacterized protein n=1 Tax=Necator americanus TaxID=51031 RepID=W2SJS2_NECAM|nr:hypothetical protein NECAME_05348 [Necator americanus]ETN69131.1 hypothetical protein NECAME_05348 [Necator americanus]
MVLLMQSPDLLTMDGTYFYFLGLLDGGGESLVLIMRSYGTLVVYWYKESATVSTPATFGLAVRVHSCFNSYLDSADDIGNSWRNATAFQCCVKCNAHYTGKLLVSSSKENKGARNPLSIDFVNAAFTENQGPISSNADHQAIDRYILFAVVAELSNSV